MSCLNPCTAESALFKDIEETANHISIYRRNIAARPAISTAVPILSRVHSTGTSEQHSGRTMRSRDDEVILREKGLEEARQFRC